VTDVRTRVVTFDLFSALLDSRAGGSRVLDSWAVGRGWPVTGEAVFDHWDAANKAAQKGCAGWVPFRELSTRALEGTYAGLALDGDPVVDCEELLASVATWPAWPDVAEGLRNLAAQRTVGILSNVDDDIFALTTVASMVSSDHVYTSQRLGAYKPSPRIYQRAAEAAPGLVHVASSARDVAGAVAAGITTVRLVRPGHGLHPASPPPAHEADDMAQVRAWLEQASRRR
jgi:2-haloacid dehalogenase